jgi:HK97 gp10 family phage protein
VAPGGIHYDNLDGWFGDLAALNQRLADEAAAELIALADVAAEALKAAAPKPRRGERAATIFVRARRGRTRTVIDVGPTSDAFSLVFDEFGTSKQPARPWARATLVGLWAAWRPWRSSQG